MPFFIALLLGLLQGLTEFLPISSSAHLLLTQKFFGYEEGDLLFSVTVHLGTLIAVCIAFRKTVKELFFEVFRTGKDLITLRISPAKASSSRRLLGLLILSLIPLFIVYPFKGYLDPLLVSPLIGGICLIFNGLILLLCDMVPAGSKTAKTAKVTDALFVGVVQCVALLPGISRSGSTITAGVCQGMKRSFAAKYSFLLSIPTILGGAILEFAEAWGEGIDPSKIPLYLTAMAGAALAGLGAILLLKKVLKSKGFHYFAIYSFILGMVTVLTEVF